MKRLFLYLILLLGLSIYGNDNPYLLSIDSLSEDVYYDLEGSWKFDLSAAVQGDPSTLAENTIFKMTPNLTASIWLFNKFFFETEIKELSLDNLFLLGYQSSDYGIQEVRLGNSELNIEEYAGYKPSSSPLNTPGARIKIASESSTQEVLIRYTKEISENIKFIGNKEVNDTNFNLNNYVTGRFFILPETVSEFKLYSYEDNNLTELDRKDYIFYNDKNLLYVINDYSKIYIESNLDESTLFNFTSVIPFANEIYGDSYDSATIWNEYYTELNSRNLLKLYIPGTFSTFQFHGAYELSGEAVDNNSLNIFGENSINYELIDNYLILYNKSLSSDNILIRYPFINENEDIYKTGGTGLSITNDFTFRELANSESYYIDENVRDNSLNVRINGVFFNDYDFDSDSGVLTINRKITQFDEIDVSYKKDSDPGIGNLLGVYGGSFNLLDNLKLELSNRVNWNFSTEDYTTEAYESIGNIESIGELTYNSEKLSAGLKSSITILNPDTTNGLELLSYSKNQNIITSEQLLFSSTIPEVNEVALINRDSNDRILTDTQIENLSPTGLNSPYNVNHEIGNIVNKSIVIETEEIEPGNYSQAVLEFDSLDKDYSWAKSLTLSYFITESREVEIVIGNLSKDVLLEANSTYSDYTIDLSSQERQKLQYVDKIKILINEGNATRLYLKNISFEGDRVWSDNSTANIKTSVSSDNLYITSDSTGHIELETEINSSNWDNYRKLTFNIENGSLINSSSTFTISLYNRNGFNRQYTLSGDRFNNGNNTITIDLENDEYNKISNSKNENKFCFTIQNSGIGSATIKPVYLKDPIYEITNDNSGFLELRPELSLKLSQVPIFETSRIYLEGNYNELNNSYKGDFEGVLLNGGFSLGGSGSDNILSEVYYSYKFPLNSPVYLEDSFVFSTSSLRENKFAIETTPVNFNFSMSGLSGSKTFIRDNKIETSIKSPVNIDIKSSVSQEEDSSKNPSIDDLVTSYYDLILEDDTYIKNKFYGAAELSSQLGIYTISLGYEGNFLQKWDTTYINNSDYSFSFNNFLDFTPLKINIDISSSYSYTLPDAQKSSLSQGFSQYIEIFEDTNPYSSINLIDLFYTDSYNNFYNDSNKMKMENITGLTVTNKTFPQSHLNILVPESLYLEIEKKYSLEGDLPVVQMNHKANLALTNSSIFKNKFIFEYSKSILNSDNDMTFTIDTLYSNRLDNNLLDLSNNFKLSDIGYTNITRADFNWKGKSGPLYIVPIINYLLDSPYNYNHTERVYLKLENSTYKVGLRHETKLEVTDTNETEAYVDIGYENESSTPFSIGLGIYTTLIF